MTVRSNLFGGKCVSCRRDVPAGKGVAVRIPRRRRSSWGVLCNECQGTGEGERDAKRN